MKLSEDVIKEELSLLEDFNKLEESSKNSEFELAKWRRVFYAYELSREVFVHFLGIYRYRHSISFEIGHPKHIEMVGRAILHILHMALLTNEKKFCAWHDLDHDRQNYLVSQFNDTVESLTSSKRLTLHNWAEHLKNCDDELWSEFTKYLRQSINGDLGEHGDVVLMAFLKPDEIGEWEHQFLRWKEKKLLAEKIPNKRIPKKGSETIKKWVMQLLKVRVLRNFGWNDYRAHKHNPIPEIQPDRHIDWHKNVYRVEKKLEQFFSLNCEILPKDRRN